MIKGGGTDTVRFHDMNSITHFFCSMVGCILWAAATALNESHEHSNDTPGAFTSNPVTA